MKINVLEQCSEFVKTATLPEQTNPREQLKWLRTYLKELREKRHREEQQKAKSSITSLVSSEKPHFADTVPPMQNF
jgi:hypothetical protein